jgi:hypothetical protein
MKVHLVSPSPEGTSADPPLIVDLRRQIAQSRAECADLQRRLDEMTTERDEALAQQTATTEVLGVINSSPGNLVPVWDAMLEKATRLCKAAAGILWIYDGARFRAIAQRGLPNKIIAELQRSPIPTASLQNIAAGALRGPLFGLFLAAVDTGDNKAALSTASRATYAADTPGDAAGLACTDRCLPAHRRVAALTKALPGRSAIC